MTQAGMLGSDWWVNCHAAGLRNGATTNNCRQAAPAHMLLNVVSPLAPPCMRAAVAWLNRSFTHICYCTTTSLLFCFAQRALHASKRGPAAFSCCIARTLHLVDVRQTQRGASLQSLPHSLCAPHPSSELECCVAPFFALKALAGTQAARKPACTT
jgi:hypothetical protein